MWWSNSHATVPLPFSVKMHSSAEFIDFTNMKFSVGSSKEAIFSEIFQMKSWQTCSGFTFLTNKEKQEKSVGIY